MNHGVTAYVQVVGGAQFITNERICGKRALKADHCGDVLVSWQKLKKRANKAQAPRGPPATQAESWRHSLFGRGFMNGNLATRNAKFRRATQGEAGSI